MLPEYIPWSHSVEHSGHGRSAHPLDIPSVPVEDASLAATPLSLSHRADQIFPTEFANLAQVQHWFNPSDVNARSYNSIGIGNHSEAELLQTFFR